MSIVVCAVLYSELSSVLLLIILTKLFRGISNKIVSTGLDPGSVQLDLPCYMDSLYIYLSAIGWTWIHKHGRLCGNLAWAWVFVDSTKSVKKIYSLAWAWVFVDSTKSQEILQVTLLTHLSLSLSLTHTHTHAHAQFHAYFEKQDWVFWVWYRE